MQISTKGRRWRAGTGLVLSIVAPALILTACTTDEHDPGASATSTATPSKVSSTPHPTTTVASGEHGDTGGGGGTDTGQTESEQPDTPGGTDTCGATPCGDDGNPGPAPGGTDTCGATPCGADSPLWDPCVISDADLTQQGLRPDSEVALSGSDGVLDKNCRWQSLGGNSELTIASTRQTVQEIQQSGEYVGVIPASVGGRSAYQYRAAQDSNRIGCYIGIPVSNGIVAFVTRNLQPDAPEDPCAAAQRMSAALVGYLP